MPEGRVHWEGPTGKDQELKLRATDIYVLPSGFRVRLAKQIGGTSWRLVGTSPHCTLCHKPSTVSGGGKSEISKSIADVVLQGPVFVRDYKSDMDEVAEILGRDFSAAYRKQPYPRASRPILSQERSLGSVIQLLTPSADFTDEYNAWLRGLPQTIRQLVFTVKRYYRPEWGDAWREHFTVNRLDGFLGHELKFNNLTLVGNYLRVGFDAEGNWRIFKLRRDFHPADKVQVEDDITVSVVLGRSHLPDVAQIPEQSSVKLVRNCEALLFQRPDEAVHRGFDKQAEADIATPGVFLSNFEPLTREQARGLVERVAEFDEYTQPMRDSVVLRRARSGRICRLVGSPANRRWEALEESEVPAAASRFRQASRPLSRGDQPAPFPGDSCGLALSIFRSTPCWRAGVAAPLTPRLDCPPSPSMARFTIRSCPSSSWTSCPVFRASRPPRPGSEARARSPRGHSTCCGLSWM